MGLKKALSDHEFQFRYSALFDRETATCGTFGRSITSARLEDLIERGVVEFVPHAHPGQVFFDEEEVRAACAAQRLEAQAKIEDGRTVSDFIQESLRYSLAPFMNSKLSPKTIQAQVRAVVESHGHELLREPVVTLHGDGTVSIDIDAKPGQNSYQVLRLRTVIE